MTFVFRRNNVFAQWVLGGIYVRVRGCFRVRGGVRCEVRARGGFRVRGRVRGRLGLGLGIILWIHEKNKCTTPVSSYRILPFLRCFLWLRTNAVTRIGK